MGRTRDTVVLPRSHRSGFLLIAIVAAAIIAAAAGATLPSGCGAKTAANAATASDAAATAATCSLAACLRQWQPHVGPKRVARRLQHCLHQ